MARSQHIDCYRYRSDVFPLEDRKVIIVIVVIAVPNLGGV